MNTSRSNLVMRCAVNSCPDNLRMAYFNARSICAESKFDEILSLVDGLDFHFIAVSETWLKPHIPSKMVEIPGYNLVRNDRLTHAGGVGIYISSHFLWKVVANSSNDSLEYLFVEVKLKNESILIGIIYNSAGGKVDQIEEILSNHSISFEHMLIAGDFNINMLSNNSTTVKFKNVLYCQNLSYMPVDQPTHFSKAHSSYSLIDLFIVSNPSLINRFVHFYFRS